MSSTVGIIGSGNIGGAVARLAIDAGFEVVLSNSRGPDSLSALAARLGDRARAATPAEAAAAGDWTVVAVPFSAVRHLPVAALAGKIVIDANNYYRSRDGEIPELLAGGVSAGELFARTLQGARTVKAFNTIYSEHLLSLARRTESPDRSAIPITGDDASAKESVTGLLDGLGYDAVDVGPTTESWRIEEGSPAYVLPYVLDPRGPLTQDPGKSASIQDIRMATAQARQQR